ncbi:MAG TPA: ketoacyl-ACP synthase III [Saprospiraceae bacterium]|nr:ketoacyl-ACP synthase III [Saprospiraceae bacterium]
MTKAKIAGVGFHVPENIITNDDLTQYMDTNDAWIQERTGIKERRWVTRGKDTTATLAAKASRIAIERAGIEAKEIDFIVFATLSADYYFPGAGVILQRELGIADTEIGAIDIKNQCTGFIYALSVASQYIETGMYKNVLVVGAEVQSMALDLSTRGRGIAVIFGDGAGAVVLQPTEEKGKGILTTKLHADGRYAEKLIMPVPGSHGGYHNDALETPSDWNFSDEKWGNSFVNEHMLKNAMVFPYMDGQHVFKMAVTKFPEVTKEALDAVHLKVSDIDLFIPHQANLRISQFVAKRLGIPLEKVVNNIQKYGNTTAASIPIALAEAWEAGRVKEGDLVCMTAFGSGFTWGSALVRW